MPEVNILNDYPQPTAPRFVGRDMRTISHRIAAIKRDRNFFDGDRNFGYGGFKYDGRWVPIAERIIKHYKLESSSRLLHLNCEKGFLINDLKNIRPSLQVAGTETSDYAIAHAMKEIKDTITKISSIKLPFPNNSFNLVIGLSYVYIHSLKGAIQALKEITRVSTGDAFITLATYETEEDYFLFKDWTLLGILLL
ncbi:MAG: methyltransferase domain-containing protein, partial [Rhodospirillaceae bacterium]|nr:methyltransferase domain-containing protein [Rhodospirillaceae bacterium]